MPGLKSYIMFGKKQPLQRILQQVPTSVRIDAPQFPGQQVKNLSDDQIRKLIKEQRRIKGFQFAIEPGTQDFNVQLSGTARILLGLALLPQAYINTVDPTAPDSNPFPYISGFRWVKNVSLKINNETVIENLSLDFLGNFINNNEYVAIPRPLSGTDQIILTFQNDSVNTELANVAFYYI